MRNFLSCKQLSDTQIEALLQRTREYSLSPMVLGGSSLLVGRMVANLFYEASTRTRVSFEVAARRLGMDVVNVSASNSSIEKGENLRDTLETLAAIGVDIAVVRHSQPGVLEQLVAESAPGLQLVNAGDGDNLHPSQALLDAAVLQSAFGKLDGLRLVIAGDIRHSRVAASALELLPRLGVEDIRLVGPKQLLPDAQPENASLMTEDFDAAIAGANAVMMLRIQHERITAPKLPDILQYQQRWGLNTERLQLANADCVVLHPGPVNRGVEISDAVADGSQSLIRQQVAMGVPARMAIFSTLLENTD